MMTSVEALRWIESHDCTLLIDKDSTTLLYNNMFFECALPDKGMRIIECVMWMMMTGAKP